MSVGNFPEALLTVLGGLLPGVAVRVEQAPALRFDRMLKPACPVLDRRLDRARAAKA